MSLKERLKIVFYPLTVVGGMASSFYVAGEIFGHAYSVTGLIAFVLFIVTGELIHLWRKKTKKGKSYK